MVAGAGLGLALAAGSAIAAPAFIPLGHLAGGDFSEATSVSDDGRFVSGNAIDASDNLVPVIWDGTTANLLAVPAGFDGAYVNAISGDGQHAVALGLGPGGFQGIRWDASGTPTVLPTNPMTFSSLNAINYDGTVAGGFVNQSFMGGSDAVIWTAAGGLQNIGVMAGGNEASFTDVTNDGSRFVGYAHDPVRRPIAWDATNGFQVLASAPGSNGAGIAIDIAADGSAIAGALDFDGVPRPAFWDSDGTANVLALWSGYAAGEAIGVINGGSLVIGNWREDEFADNLRSLAFVWDADSGSRPLQDVLINDYGIDLTGWTLNTVSHVTPDGLTIVGAGLNPFGELEAFKVVIPAPAGFAAFTLAGLGALARRRR
ncbi:MAG: hypothetical protein EA378_09280 [Phycisphaerales bacterium]|nr:MAG: hypothetical protein EA378_09280 [Phycisphaerales bacterium]